MRRLLLATLLAAAAAGAASAETILARRYGSAKLDGLWRGTLGTEPPPVEAFALLAPDGGAPAPVRPAAGAAPDFGVPFAGEVLGEAAPGPAEAARAFPVIPLSAAEAAPLARRLAWAEIWLGRYRFHERASTDDAAALEALAARQRAAALEAYLVTARLYYAAATLPEKCVRLTRLAELAPVALAGAEPPPGWAPLVAAAAATGARLGAEALAATACAVRPVRGRAETLRLVETRVRERVMREVRAKVDETLTLLEGASAELQSLVAAMDAPIAAAEIMELERRLGDAAANVRLVKEDQLEAAATVATLEAVDLSSLDQPDQLREFTAAEARLGEMTALIEAVLAVLAALPEATPDPALRASFEPCARLRGAYAALDLAQDAAAAARAVAEPYETCLASVAAAVEARRAPSLASARTAALARHLRLLSDAWLATAAP